MKAIGVSGCEEERGLPGGQGRGGKGQGRRDGMGGRSMIYSAKSPRTSAAGLQAGPKEWRERGWTGANGIQSTRTSWGENQ